MATDVLHVLAETDPQTITALVKVAMEKGGAFAVGVMFLGAPALWFIIKIAIPAWERDAQKKEARAIIERDAAVAHAAAASHLKQVAETLNDGVERVSLTQDMANETLEQARELIKQAIEIRTSHDPK